MSDLGVSATPALSGGPAVLAGKEEAVIYVGATSVSLLIGVRGKGDVFEAVDYLDRPLPVARDIFRTGSITRGTKEQATLILRDYLTTTQEYGIPLERVRLFNTNILSEEIGRAHV